MAERISRLNGFVRNLRGALRQAKTTDERALPPRFPSIVLAVLTGIALAFGLAWLLYGWGTPDWATVQALRKAAANQPPWVLFSGIVAAPSLVLIWWWRTTHKDEDVAQAKRTERNTRFIEAVKLLTGPGESVDVEAWLGGIYSLEALARDAPEERQRVLETLCAVLRLRGDPAARDRQPHHIQAAFVVVGRVPRPAGMALDLRGANLPKVDAPRSKLRLADLSQATLAGANLDGSDLSQADLFQADLTGAILNFANLRDANLNGTKFAMAHLAEVFAEEVTFHDAVLDGAWLVRADLRKAQVVGTSMAGATLRDALLDDAQLIDADLRGTDLRGASVKRTKCRRCTYDRLTKLPDGFSTEGMTLIEGKAVADVQEALEETKDKKG